MGLTQRDAYRVMLREYPDVLNIDELCEILEISKKTAYNLLKQDKIACLKVGRAYRIPKSHLLTYLGIGGHS
ncbi:MAG: helix-turn-helix domain-containing protein [Hydrogenoanaerobacterium sp.]